MRTWNTSIACAVLLCASAARAEDPAQTQKSEAVSINPKEMKWTDAPPDLPKGAKIAVLHGDPFKTGPFVMRLKAPSGYKIPLHWHAQDENLTVMRLHSPRKPNVPLSWLMRTFGSLEQSQVSFSPFLNTFSAWVTAGTRTMRSASSRIPR